MTRIDAAFRRLRASGERGLVVYLTAGDPTPAASLRYSGLPRTPGPTSSRWAFPFPIPRRMGQRSRRPPGGRCRRG